MKLKLMKVLALLASIAVLALGCFSGSPAKYEIITPYPTAMLSPEVTSNPLPSDYRPPENRTWISPGVVNVGNFHPGARAEWNITIHNGNQYITERKIATTWLTDTSVIVALKFKVYGDPSLTQIASALGKDKPVVSSFDHDANTITIEGLAVNEKRELDITYQYWSVFEVKYRIPDHVQDGYSMPTNSAVDWVIVADETPVMAPLETKEINIALDMPGDAIAPAPKWEFWISVVDATQGGMVTTECCSTWLVDMRT